MKNEVACDAYSRNEFIQRWFVMLKEKAWCRLWMAWLLARGGWYFEKIWSPTSSSNVRTSFKFVVSQMSQLVSVWTKSESVCVPNMMRINFKCCISVRISPHG